MTVPTDSAFALDRSFAFAASEEGAFSAHTSAEFGNRFGPYGGWIAALLTKALLSGPVHGELLAVTVNFLGGCEDGPLTGATRLLRRNRTNEFWTAEFADSKNPVAQASAVFGVRRKSVALGDLPPPAPAPAPEEIAPRPLVTGMPEFFRRYDVRQFGFKPFAVNPTASSRMYIREADGRPLDLVSLVAHADAPIPRIFLKSDVPVPIATMTMTVYIHAQAADLSEVGSDYVLIDADCRSGHDGFYDQVARLWSRSGKLLATSEQLVWFKARS